MKNQSPFKLLALSLGLAVVSLPPFGSPIALAGNTWDGGGADTNWSTDANWNPDGQPAYGTLTFSGSTRTTNVVNINYSENQLLWTGTSAWTLNSSSNAVISLFDFGGTQAKVENQSTGLVTINAPITFAANNASPPNPFGEINAVNGNILFSGSALTVNGSSVNGIKMFSAGHTVTYNNTVSASGKWFGLTAVGSSMAVGGSFTSGDIYVMNSGTLSLNSGGSISTTGIRLGGDFGNTGNQDQTKGGTFLLSSSTGAQTFSGVINSVAGNTSGALLVNSTNTSGTNTLSGNIFLDSALKFQNSAGGTLVISGTGDVKQQVITFTPAGTMNYSGPLTSSSAAGGSLVKSGAGTLILSNTNNSYTGTNSNSLNANGTQIASGTLGIVGDTSLGLAPTGAYNNIQFTGTATLQDTSNNITLAATRNISIAASGTASFDTLANTMTIGGVINGAGALTKLGTGALILSGSNTYTGVTTLSSGTLVLANPGALAGTANLTITTAATATLAFATDGGDAPFSTQWGTTTSPTIISDRATAGAGISHTISSGSYGGGTISIVKGANVTSGTASVTFSAVSLTAGTVQTTTFNPTTANVSIGTVTIGLNNQIKTLGLDGTSTGNTVTGAITNGAGTVAVTKSNTSTWALSGSSSYTGITTISGNGGTLQLQANSGNTSGGVTSVLGATSELLLSSTTTLQLLGNTNNTIFKTGGTPAATSTTTGIIEAGNGPFNFAVGNNGSGTGNTLILANFGQFGAGGTAPTFNFSSANGYNLQLGSGVLGTGSMNVFNTTNYNSNTAGSTVSIPGGININFNSAYTQTFGGVGNFNVGSITQPNAGRVTVSKTGAGTLTLSGTNTYSGSTNVAAGQIVSTGLITQTGTMAIGNTNGSAGAFYQTGNVTQTSANGGAFDIGSTAGAFGYYKITSGTLTTGGELDPGGAGGGAGTFGQFDMSGGTLNMPNNGSSYILPNRGATGEASVVNFTGGTVQIAGGGTPGDGNFNGLSINWAGGGQTNTTTISGSAQFLTPSLQVKLNQGTAFNGLGVGGTNNVTSLNLSSGGLLQTLGFLNGAVAVNPNISINFNGGTIKAGTADNATFLAGLGSVNLYAPVSGTNTIDNNGRAITIGQAFLGASGTGVSSVAISGSGSSYIVPPRVVFSGGTITGGTGSGATGYATIDPTTGVLTGIVITNPGTYTSTAGLTVSLTGTTAGTAAALGAISLNAGNTSGGMTYTGIGTTTLSGASTYSGATKVSAGTLSLTGTLGSGAGTAISNSATFTESSAGVITGTSSVSNTAGTTNLAGVNTYSGATSVTGGTMTLSGAGSINSSSGITISGTNAKYLHTSSVASTQNITLTQGTLDGTGTVGAVTVGAGTGGIITNGNGTTAQLTLNSLTFNGGGTINFLLAGGTTNAAGLVVSTALTTSGTASSVLVNISPTSPLNLGTAYNLIGFSSFLGNTTDFTYSGNTARVSGSFGNSGSFITLTVNGDAPKWTGFDDGTWQVGSTGTNGNWKLISANTATDYIQGDAVTFDDSATGTTTVNISGSNVSPSSTTFTNNTLSYTIGSTGGFGIAGTGPLVKSGSGTVILTASNSYSGLTTINAGTLQLGDGTNDGTIASTSGVTDNGTLAYNWASNHTAGYAITGTGAVTKTGAGILTLTASNSYSGGTSINGGAISIASDNNLGASSGGVTLNGGTLSTTAGITNTHVFTIGAAGGTINVAGAGAFYLHTANTLLGSGSLTLTGNGTIAQTGAGNLRVDATNTYSGNVTMNSGGIFEYGAANVVASGASFTLGNQGEFAVQNATTVANNVTVSGGSNSILSFENGTTGIYSGTLTLNANGIIGLRDWYNNATARGGTISGLISGTGGLTVITNTGNAAGTLTLTNTNNYTGATTISAGTLQLGDGTNDGTIASTSGVTDNATLAYNWVGSHTAGYNIAGTGAVTKSGTGILTLSGSNSYTGATTVSAGTLNYSGTLSSAGQINVGVAGGGNAVLNVLPGANIAINSASNTNVLIGLGTTSTTGQGFVYQSGGNISNSGAYTQFQIGAATTNVPSYGYYNLSGGTLSVNEVDIGGFNGSSVGVLDMSGGTITIASNGWLIASRSGNSGSIGILNLTGGTINYNGPSGQFQNNWGSNGTAVINVANATLSATNADINLNQSNNATNFGEINLLTGGTMQAHSIASGSNGTKLVNFNGGTLKASTATTTFITTNNTAANVYGNGGTINNNGVNITIPVGLLAASGSGVNSVAVTGSGSGYLGAPAVTFSGGGGTGASGYAVLTSGSVSSIVITNPGTGYTSAPGITLTGGGGSGATLGTAILTTNTSGGMIFMGSGTTTLTGASTYTSTTVNGGTLDLAHANPSNLGTGAIRGSLTINSGATVLTSQQNALGYDSGIETTAVNINGGTLNNTSAGDQGYGTTFNLTGGTMTSNGGVSSGTTGSVFVLGKQPGGADAVNTFASGTTSTIAGRVMLAGENSNSNVAFTVADGAAATDLLVTAAMTERNGPVGITKAGAGTMRLSGSNTYTGATAINNGTLSISGTHALGGTSLVNIAGGATLGYTGGASTLAKNITVTSGTGTVSNTGSGTLGLSGTLTKLDTTLALSGNFNITGVITGTSGTFDSDLAIVSGTTTISGTNNSYYGATNVSSGATLVNGANNALPTSTVVNLDGTYNLGGFGQTIAGLGGAGAVTNTGASTLTVNNDSATSNSDYTYSGVIANGSGVTSLTKTGDKTLTLTGSNTFTGATTVSGGTLAASSPTGGALGSTASVTVNTGGTLLLGGNNQINDSASVDLHGGTLNTGGNTETVGALTLSANSTIDFSSLQTGTLNFTTGTYSAGLLTIDNWVGSFGGGTNTHLVFGTAPDASFLAQVQFSGGGYSQGANAISYGGGFELAPIPEPATIVGAAALLGFIGFRERRRLRNAFKR